MLANKHEIKVLDHGFVRLVETWGHGDADVPEAGIVEAARQSTQGSFRGWETDEKLLGFLFNNKPQHATPFEFAGMVIEVKAPIFVFREWHRHRTQCLAGGTKLYFDLPGGVDRRGTQKYTLTIKEVFERFQPTTRSDRPERQENALRPRHRLQNMLLRCANEETLHVQHTHIVDAWESGEKDIFDVMVEGVGTIRCSEDHRFFTPSGWRRLKEISAEVQPQVYISRSTATNEAGQSFFVAPNEAEELWKSVVGWENWYEVSNMGRVRRVAEGRGVRDLNQPKRLTVDATGYLCTNVNRPGVQERPHVHRLVLEAFIGPCPVGQECRHLDGNSLNNRLSNLLWGTSQENAADRALHGTQRHLGVSAASIQSVRRAGREMTYDIEVAGPFHNFVADGFVVHNSYNEMSARYAPLPDQNYIPSVERIMIGGGHLNKNKQAAAVSGAAEITEKNAELFQMYLRKRYEAAEELYQDALKNGVPKELARVILPVGRYSQMRAGTSLRNWLAFMTLRADKGAQWEIQQYANAVGQILKENFPRTWALFEAARNA